MCNTIIRDKFFKKLQKYKLDTYFIKVFGENFTANKLNLPGWWFHEDKILFCVGEYPEDIKMFLDNNCWQATKIRQIIQKMGYKFEYTFRENFIIFLKENVLS